METWDGSQEGAQDAYILKKSWFEHWNDWPRTGIQHMLDPTVIRLGLVKSSRLHLLFTAREIVRLCGTRQKLNMTANPACHHGRYVALSGLVSRETWGEESAPHHLYASPPHHGGASGRMAPHQRKKEIVLWIK